MQRLLLVLATILLVAPATAQNLDSVAAAALAGTHAPAVAVLAIHDGKITGDGVAGVRRNDRPDKAREGDVWLIGSDAKPMTASLIARLVDEGKLAWTTPLSQMLPGLAKTMRPEYRQMTLTQLLSHHAGLPHDYSDLAYFNTFFTDKRAPAAQRYAYVGRALTEAPVAPPGTKFSYSNTGFILAAVIAEVTTGTSYEDLMRREVFGPLGMTSVGFGLPHGAEPSGHVHGKPVSKPEDSNPAMFAPAGNINLTLRDWARFCLDQMAGYQGHGKLLSPASYHLMRTPIAPGENVGLGWGVAASFMGRKGPMLEHAGSDGNWYAIVALFPAKGDGILVASNAGEDMGGDKAAKAALKALLPPAPN